MDFYTVEEIKDYLQDRSDDEIYSILDTIDDVVLIELCVLDPFFNQFQDVLIKNVKDDYLKYKLFYRLPVRLQKFLVYQLDSNLIKMSLLLDSNIDWPVKKELIKVLDSIDRPDILYTFYRMYHSEMPQDIWEMVFERVNPEDIQEMFLIENDLARLKYIVKNISDRTLLLDLYPRLNSRDYRRLLLKKVYTDDWSIE
jgi:hypothetical protein